jgi:hypothetical protein
MHECPKRKAWTGGFAQLFEPTADQSVWQELINGLPVSLEENA